jgi:hypothetical protein
VSVFIIFSLLNFGWFLEFVTAGERIDQVEQQTIGIDNWPNAVVDHWLPRIVDVPELYVCQRDAAIIGKAATPVHDVVNQSVVVDQPIFDDVGGKGIGTDWRETVFDFDSVLFTYRAGGGTCDRIAVAGHRRDGITFTFVVTQGDMSVGFTAVVITLMLLVSWIPGTGAALKPGFTLLLREEGEHGQVQAQRTTRDDNLPATSVYRQAGFECHPFPVISQFNL